MTPSGRRAPHPVPGRATARSRAGVEVPRPRRGMARAWIESPLQLLGAVEAHNAGLLGEATLVRPRAGLRGLDAWWPSAGPRLPPGFVLGAPAPFPTPAGRVGADRWVVGDAYSGRVQRALLGPGRVGEVVVLDERLSTLDLLRDLSADGPRPLVRPGPPRGPGRRALGLAAWHRLRRLARRGRLLAVTALPVPPGVEAGYRAVGGHLERHGFEWLASLPVPEPVDEPTVVVGSSLVADGLVREGPFVRWVLGLAEEGPVGYFPHPREPRSILEALAPHSRVHVHPYTMPVEFRLRGLRRGQTLRALPSGTLASLGLLLPPGATALRGQPVPEDWWTDAAPEAVRRGHAETLAAVDGGAR